MFWLHVPPTQGCRELMRQKKLCKSACKGVLGVDMLEVIVFVFALPGDRSPVRIPTLAFCAPAGQCPILGRLGGPESPH